MGSGDEFQKDLAELMLATTYSCPSTWGTYSGIDRQVPADTDGP